MASITVSREDIFPEGTSVDAYEAVGLGRTPSSGAPAGSSAGSGTVTDGVLSITGLDADKVFILYAGSPDRYLRASTMETASGGGGDVTQQDLDDAIAAHAADTTAVHGISDTAFIKGVVVDVDGGAVARPEFLSVEFVQLNDPDTLGDDGDTWSPTGAP